MNSIKEVTLNSHTYYTEIKKIFLKEKTTVDIKGPKYIKGDVISAKRPLFGKPINKYAETDLYETTYHDYDYRTHKGLVTADVLASQRGVYYDSSKKEFYRKAKVEITFRNDKTETYLFDETKDAFDFLEEIKEKCLQCGNKLL